MFQPFFPVGVAINRPRPFDALSRSFEPRVPKGGDSCVCFYGSARGGRE